jgi:hypothetical protein
MEHTGPQSESQGERIVLDHNCWFMHLGRNILWLYIRYNFFNYLDNEFFIVPNFLYHEIV